MITSENDIFGTQPFLAIKTKENKYYWDNLDFSDKNRWSYTFDNHTFIYDNIQTIGIASNNNYGVTEVLHYDCLTNVYRKVVLNAK